MTVLQLQVLYSLNNIGRWEWIVNRYTSGRFIYYLYGGARWCSLLRYFARRREAPGSNPGRVLGSFQVAYCFWPLSVALGSTQPLKEMSTKEFPWGYNVAGAYSRQFCRLNCAECQNKGGSPTFHHPSEFSSLLMRKLYIFIYLFARKRPVIWRGNNVHALIHGVSSHDPFREPRGLLWSSSFTEY